MLLTPDHVVPLALGGSSLISNVQPLCGACNSWKDVKGWTTVLVLVVYPTKL